MDRFEIKCADKSEPRAGGHQHITEVGIGKSRFTVEQIIGLIERKKATFYTVSPTTGRISEVSPFDCSCGYKTIRSHADGVWDNNLDNLASCSLAA